MELLKLEKINTPAKQVRGDVTERGEQRVMTA